MDTGVSTQLHLTTGTFKGTNMPLWERISFLSWSQNYSWSHQFCWLSGIRMENYILKQSTNIQGHYLLLIN